MQGNKSLCAAVTISATLVNIQTHSDLVRGEMTTVCVCVCAMAVGGSRTQVECSAAEVRQVQRSSCDVDGMD